MIRARRAAGAAALLGALACGLPSVCDASSTRYCDRQVEPTAAEKDRLFRFGAIIKTELEQSGRSVALVSRSGLDLSRFDVRYSHAGVSLKASPNTPWSVRQLYYACDEGKPRIFDEGISGFLLGTDDASLGYVSVVLLPPAESAALERAALDKRQALQFLGPAYSANAYPFSARYQNCNQWLIELLAAAWGPSGESPDPPADDPDRDDPRERAQRWLREQGYAPSVLEVGSRLLMWFGAFIPWVHSDDHPRAEIEQKVYSVSMPASIEAFVRATVPQAERIEFCHTDRYAVVRRGWEPIAAGCRPEGQDTVIGLD